MEVGKKKFLEKLLAQLRRQLRRRQHCSLDLHHRVKVGEICEFELGDCWMLFLFFCCFFLGGGRVVGDQ